MSGGAEQNPSTSNDPNSFAKVVKDAFESEKGKYKMFRQVVKDYKAQRIGENIARKAGLELFKGHDDLISGFEAFLPVCLQIPLPQEPLPLPALTQIGAAGRYMNDVKARFEANPYLYLCFITIVSSKTKCMTEVYLELAVLFKDHQDLLEEFMEKAVNGAETISFISI